MARITRVGLVAVVALGVAASAALAQPAVPVKQLPPGFKVVSNTAAGSAINMEAVKPNAAKPQIAVDTDIHVKFTWRLSPGFDRVVQMMAASPEDAAIDQGTIKDEPAGRTRLKGGVLTFRKKTVLQIGTGSGQPWVSYDGVWIAAIDGGMTSVSVMNYAGPKEDIQPWIEAMIPAAK